MEPTYSQENIFYGVIPLSDDSELPRFDHPYLGIDNSMLLAFDRGEFISFFCGRNPVNSLIWAITYRWGTLP